MVQNKRKGKLSPQVKQDNNPSTNPSWGGHRNSQPEFYDVDTWWHPDALSVLNHQADDGEPASKRQRVGPRSTVEDEGRLGDSSSEEDSSF